jgi:hypothetical protein
VSRRRDNPLPADLERLVRLVEDIAYYRTISDDGGLDQADAGLGQAAWVELHLALREMPERLGDYTVIYKAE